MINTVIFDMYETLITLWHNEPYMGREISLDADIPEHVFREIWDKTEEERTLGKLTYEEVIERILRANNKYSEELYKKLIRKRIATNVDSFKNLHDQIVPMLEQLKQMNVKIGIITNCYLEEAKVIEESIIYPYFDVVCMSCKLALKKPDKRVFDICLNKLESKPEECIYCGDGGSNELEVAKQLGMKPVQALWYLWEGSGQPVGRMQEYVGANVPLDIITMINESNM